MPQPVSISEGVSFSGDSMGSTSYLNLTANSLTLGSGDGRRQKYCFQTYFIVISLQNLRAPENVPVLLAEAVSSNLSLGGQEFSRLEIATATVTIQSTHLPGRTCSNLVRAARKDAGDNTLPMVLPRGSATQRVVNALVVMTTTECSPATPSQRGNGVRNLNILKFTIDNVRRPNEFPNTATTRIIALPVQQSKARLITIIIKRHKLEGRDFCLRVPVTPVEKMLPFDSLTILKIITINNCNC